MAQLWGGRFTKETDKLVYNFNASISFDQKFYKQDIEGSIAHATMLGAAGIIDKGESEKICAELEKIEKDIETGALHIDPDAEDIHTFIEGELTARIGDAGKRLHTARSRNDQVALDVRLTLRKECAGLMEQLKELINVLCDQAEEYADTVMPGYTHLQRAQPITFGHHLMAYAEMFLRDIGRMQDALKRMDVCPLGSGALAGTTYPLDRDLTAKLLGFSGVSRNSLDGVADRAAERLIHVGDDRGGLASGHVADAGFNCRRSQSTSLMKRAAESSGRDSSPLSLSASAAPRPADIFKCKTLRSIFKVKMLCRLREQAAAAKA